MTMQTVPSTGDALDIFDVPFTFCPSLLDGLECQCPQCREWESFGLENFETGSSGLPAAIGTDLVKTTALDSGAIDRTTSNLLGSNPIEFNLSEFVVGSPAPTSTGETSATSSTDIETSEEKSHSQTDNPATTQLADQLKDQCKFVDHTPICEPVEIITICSSSEEEPSQDSKTQKTQHDTSQRRRRSKRQHAAVERDGFIAWEDIPEEVEHSEGERRPKRHRTASRRRTRSYEEISQGLLALRLWTEFDSEYSSWTQACWKALSLLFVECRKLEKFYSPGLFSSMYSSIFKLRSSIYRARNSMYSTSSTFSTKLPLFNDKQLIDALALCSQIADETDEANYDVDPTVVLDLVFQNIPVIQQELVVLTTVLFTGIEIES